MSQATLVPNRINTRMADPKKVLSIYFTAGYPEEEDYTKNYKDLELFNTALKKRFLPLKNTL